MKINNTLLPLLLVSCILTFGYGQNQPGLHVEENQTVVFGKDTTSAGIKLLWYPSKAALRAGKNSTTEWINSNVGPFSTGFGLDTEARGYYSSAFGQSTLAYSYGETSFGRFSLGGGFDDIWVTSDPLFEIGNGESKNSRANAFTVYKNGNANVQGSLNVGDHAGTSIANGTIRYSGSDFQGRVGGVWQSLTSGNGGGGASPWSTANSNIVYYNNGGVGIGTSNPLDDLTIFGNNGLEETIGITLRNGKTTIPLGGGIPTGPSSIGRIWQTPYMLNIGLSDGVSKISFDNSSIKLYSPNFNTNWGFNFQHFDVNFAFDNRRQTWLKKAWRGDLGDYLYIGSTGNRPIEDQHAMLLTQSAGIQFGRGNTNEGDGLGNNIIEMNIGSFSNSIHSTEPLHITADEKVSFYGAGEVGGVTIGTSILPSGYRVAVDGKIAAEEVLVQLSGLWPDYVFQQDYELMNLNQLETFIKKNNHLPGIPTATDIGEEGIEVGEMQKLQMEKIEELTLYIIELQKEISKLKSKVDSL